MKETKRKVVSIGEAARICNVTVKQIRFWEERGYIPSAQRVICGERSYRKYGKDDLGKGVRKGVKSPVDSYSFPTRVNRRLDPYICLAWPENC